MPKSGCGMIAFRNNLVVFGGYGIPEKPLDPHSHFISGIGGKGWTNELHIYNLSEGNYVPPFCFLTIVFGRCLKTMIVCNNNSNL